jgi:L-fuculose-phosphate aldolase
MRLTALRRAVIRTVRWYQRLGLGVGTAGNASARCAGGFLITPTGMNYTRLLPTDIVRCDARGKPAAGQRKPSSEWRMHRDILATRSDCGAVVHVHSPFATALSCLRRDIPDFHYMVAKAGGDSIRCARYATFGTAALSRYVLRALAGRQACLMANHGQIALGTDLAHALDMAQEVEELSKQYWLALHAGRPVRLGRCEMQKVLGKFRNYGRQ